MFQAPNGRNRNLTGAYLVVLGSVVSIRLAQSDTIVLLDLKGEEKHNICCFPSFYLRYTPRNSQLN